MEEKNLRNMGGNFSGGYDDQNDGGDDDKFEDGEKKRSKRRSKNDNEGRSYTCNMCGKSYLSYPALYTHIKTKHNTTGQASTRGRGRPKKDTGDINSIKLLYNPSNFDFFKHPDRIGETTNLYECMEAVFRDVYQNHEKNFEKFKKYNSRKEHNFYNKVIELSQSPRPLDGENSKCDEVFAEYVVKVSKVCGRDFFVKVLKFVTIFRECLNILNRGKTVGSEDYSEVNTAEDAPDISNDFVTDFLEKYPDLFDFTKEDAIDMTQNFCQWMYDNNYTCSRLSLINT